MKLKRQESVFIRVIGIIALLCMWCFVGNAAAVIDYWSANTFSRINNVDKTATGELVIPEVAGGVPVTDVRNMAFYGCDKITMIVFPSQLKYFVSYEIDGYRGSRMYPVGGNNANSVFEGCWALTNAVFKGEPPWNLQASGLLVYADMIHYPIAYSNQWRKVMTNIGYGGKWICYSGEWPDITPVLENGKPIGYVEPPNVITNFTYETITNEVVNYTVITNVEHIYTTVTNVVKYVPEPGTSPDAGYAIGAGENRELAIAGAAGWDAFGVPDGMEWDKATGTLSGQAKRSGTYDMMLVSGSGADTQIMRTTITVAPFDKIVGYVGVAFSQSGAPLDNLKSYKTLPAGLKWKNGVLSGVPTKAQTLDLETADGEPVKIEIKALPDSVVGTFDGCVYFPPSDPTNGVANTCDIGGTITLTATAAGKISASVKTAKKTYSFSMASWAKFAEGNAFTLEASAELKTGEVLEVNATVRDGATMVLAKLSGGEFGDDGCVTMLVKDVYAKNGSKWIDEEAHGLMAKCKGTYQFGFDAVEDGGHGVTALPAWTLRPVAKVEASFLKVVLKDTGVATITGTLPDKTKVNLSAKATASAVDGSDKIEIKILSAAFSGKTITLPVEINLMNDGSFAEGRTNCGIIYSVER